MDMYQTLYKRLFTKTLGAAYMNDRSAIQGIVVNRHQSSDFTIFNVF